MSFVNYFFFQELHSLEPPIAIPAIGEKTLKRKQFLKDVSIR